MCFHFYSNRDIRQKIEILSFSFKLSAQYWNKFCYVLSKKKRQTNFVSRFIIYYLQSKVWIKTKHIFLIAKFPFFSYERHNHLPSEDSIVSTFPNNTSFIFFNVTVPKGEKRKKLIHLCTFFLQLELFLHKKRIKLSWFCQSSDLTFFSFLFQYVKWAEIGFFFHVQITILLFPWFPLQMCYLSRIKNRLW